MTRDQQTKKPEGAPIRTSTPKLASQDPRVVMRDEKKLRMPVGLIIIAIWAIMVVLVMNIQTFVRTGGNLPVSETSQAQPVQ